MVLKKLYLRKVLVSGTLIFFVVSAMGAGLSNPDRSPYEYGPQGRAIQDIMDYKKPNEMMNIIPNRPVVAKDKNGTRQYYTPNGKMVLSVAIDGSMTFSLKGVTIEKDFDGKVTGEERVVAGTARKELRDGKGQITGYQDLGYGTNVLREYDEDKDLTKTYEFNKYGRMVTAVIDELTQTRTVFDSKGLPSYDINSEGGVVARYYYDSKNVLLYKEDRRLNKTYYGSFGEMSRTEDAYGNVILKYNYVTDEAGRYILDNSVDNNARITYYDKGKPQVEKNKQGEITKEYYYENDKLVFTFEKFLRETVWYDQNGKQLYASIDNEVVREWFYWKKKLIGLWETSKNTLIAYINDDEVGRYYIQNKPTAKEIQDMIDNGTIKKRYEE